MACSVGVRRPSGIQGLMYDTHATISNGQNTKSGNCKKRDEKYEHQKNEKGHEKEPLYVNP